MATAGRLNSQFWPALRAPDAIQQTQIMPVCWWMCSQSSVRLQEAANTVCSFCFSQERAEYDLQVHLKAQFGARRKTDFS